MGEVAKMIISGGESAFGSITVANSNLFTVSGLKFRPKKIACIYCPDFTYGMATNDRFAGIYDADSGTGAYNYLSGGNYLGGSTSNPFNILSDGFTFYGPIPNGRWYWIACA